MSTYSDLVAEVGKKQVNDSSLLDPFVLWDKLKIYWQTYGAGSDPKLPTMPTPGMQPPPGPKTAPKMQTWAPDDVGEAYAQKQVQYESDAAAVLRNSGATSSAGADFTPPPPPDLSLSAWLVTAIALGAVAAGFILLPSGRSR